MEIHVCTVHVSDSASPFQKSILKQALKFNEHKCTKKFTFNGKNGEMTESFVVHAS